MATKTEAVNPEVKEFNDAYARMKAFVSSQPGPALQAATLWHLLEIKLLKTQIENMQTELKDQT